MGNETEREAFEQLVRETCSTDEYTFKRDGGAYFRLTCAKTYDGLPPREMASVQTLWNFYQAGAAYQRAQPSGIEITKLLSCVRYLTGIAERGLKRQIREDESVESFVLGYVQSLETQPGDDVATDAWIPVGERLPDGIVLAHYRNHYGTGRTIRAQYVRSFTVEAGADCDDVECCTYSEQDDCYYLEEGWYEQIDNWGDYSSVAVTEGQVTHWMPLPAAPAAQGGK